MGRLGKAFSAALAILALSCSSSEDAPAPVIEPVFQWQNLDSLQWAEILEAEDARAVNPDDLAPVVAGLSSPIAELRIVAVRALGRLERPALVSEILPILQDTIAAVRAEAANALGQAVCQGGGELVLRPLLDRLGDEPDAYVRGVIAQTLGRLPYQASANVRLVDAALVGALADTAPAALVGAARGLASLVRRQVEDSPPSERAIERLRELARYRSPYGARDVTALQVRRLAMEALAGSGRMDAGFLMTVLVDRDVQVRRLAVEAAGTVEGLDGRMNVITRALSDDDGKVRLAAIRAYGRHAQRTSGCGALVAALDDPDPDVALTAIDLLGDGCGTDLTPVDRLRSMVEEFDPVAPVGGSHMYPDSWHQPAHAIVALAEVAPGQAAPHIRGFAAHQTWWLRMYAARAAAALDSVECLEMLARDEHDNVREAAVRELYAIQEHDADPFYLEQLSRSDYQLVMTAARALADTPNPARALPALFDALERISAERRETSRDVRRALIRRIGALGGRNQAVALIPYLRDFDPVIAEDVAGILRAWTGRAYSIAPRRLSRLPLPGFGELARLTDEIAVLVMRGGARIELKLFPFEAPANVARFSRLARDGYYDGLTFHRVSRNFVIQGGSPAANEYVGDGAFTRDELTTRSHLRGTVGISTRGRDTGDGQIFVNLMDNPRLDHNYTIIGQVVEGMDVVDAILEGTVIERIDWESQENR